MVKVDLVTRHVAKFYYENERFGGELWFVPVETARRKMEGISELVIVDASSLKRTSVVKLPNRVSYGFMVPLLVPSFS